MPVVHQCDWWVAGASALVEDEARAEEEARVATATNSNFSETVEGRTNSENTYVHKTYMTSQWQ